MSSGETGGVMFCARCGNQIPEGSRFCESCGAPVSQEGSAPSAAPPTPPTGQPVAPPPAQQWAPQQPGTQVVMPAFVSKALDRILSPGALGRDWLQPALGAVVAIALALGISIGMQTAVNRGEVAEIGEDVAEDSGLSFIAVPAPEVMGGGITFYRLQRVAGTQAPARSGVQGRAIQASGTVIADHESFSPGDVLRVKASPLGGLLLVGIAIAIGGSVAARLRGGTASQRLAAGCRLAVPYAILAFIGSFIFVARNVGDRADLSVSHVGALFLPLLWGVLFGLIGASVQVYGRGWWRQALVAIEQRFRGWSAAVWAAFKALRLGFLLVGLGLAAGIVALVVQNPDGAGDFFGSGRGIIAFVIGVVLLLPHAMVLGLLMAMGGALHVASVGDGPFDEAGFAISILGLGGGGESLGLPAFWLIGFAIAAVTVISLGYHAARTAGNDARGAMLAALRAVVPFCVFLWLVALLLGMRITGRDDEDAFSLGMGPAAVTTIFYPLLWGLGGALAGAMLYLRRHGLVVPRMMPAAAPAPATWPPPAPQQPMPPAPQQAMPPAPQPAAAATAPPVPAAAPPEGSQRFCAQCGTANPPGNRFCEGCGSALGS